MGRYNGSFLNDDCCAAMPAPRELKGALHAREAAADDHDTGTLHEPFTSAREGTRLMV